MKILALVLDPYEVARLGKNLGEPTQAPPVTPSRFVVQTEWDFPDAARSEQPAASAEDQAAAPWDEVANPPVPPAWDEFADSPVPPLWDDFAPP